MKTIMPPTMLSQKLIGKQKYVETNVYRLSRFVIQQECEAGKLLFNTLTGELVLVSMKSQDEENRELAEKFFLFPIEKDEIQICDEVRHMARMLQNTKGAITHFTILTTTDCNARCFYCYEKGTRRFSMSSQTAQRVLEHIAAKCAGSSVKLSWFGGEPLCNWRVIDTICAGLTARGIEYTSIMTSNGFYLTPDVAQKAKSSWHVTTIQITVDGTEEIYNKTKAYRDVCVNPYERVLGNIKSALDVGLTIGIRLNMDAKNAKDLFRLADILGERYRDRPNVHVHVEPLREFVGQIHSFGSAEELLDCYWKLTDKLIHLGLHHQKELITKLRINQCMADSDNSEVILPDGRIAKCEHVDERDTIGSIWYSARNEEGIASWKEIIRYPECRECPLYPLCISLKKCAWNKDGCPEHVRRGWIERVKRQMLEAYRGKHAQCRGSIDQ